MVRVSASTGTEGKACCCCVRAQAEIMKMVELQPISSHDERDLLHLITFSGAGVEEYTFQQYLAHAEAFGLHGAFKDFRERMLDKD